MIFQMQKSPLIVFPRCVYFSLDNVSSCLLMGGLVREGTNREVRLRGGALGRGAAIAPSGVALQAADVSITPF